MKLIDTVQLMNSEDYKERFRAEYFQLENRVIGLSTMLDKYRKNELDFTPKCTLKMLDGQLHSMKTYMTHLKERAKLEGIDLSEEVNIETLNTANDHIDQTGEENENFNELTNEEKPTKRKNNK